MSSLFSKALVYLGLVDEDEIDGDQDPAFNAGSPEPTGYQRRGSVDLIPEGRRVEPPPTSRAATRPQARPDLPPTALVTPIEVRADILLVEEFADARVLADRVRARTPVVMDMRQTDPELVRRVVDFASGLIYALDGTMRKVGDGLVLVLPPRVSLNREEKRRLASLGAYELDELD
jgi:cell division inhibitor SepF